MKFDILKVKLIAVIGLSMLLGINISYSQQSQKLQTWGSQAYGELGNGLVSKPVVPQKVDKWVKVASGSGAKHVLGINSNGELYAWGYNYYCQLGVGLNAQTRNVNYPKRVGTASNWTSIAVGTYHSKAINSSGQLYAWGINSSSDIGNGLTNSGYFAPQRVGTASNWVSIAAGANHTLAINSNGRLYAWGKNDYGQLGIGNNTNQNVPVPVDSATNWIYVEANGSHSFAIKSNGELYAWGNNGNGQLGDGTDTTRDRPVRIGSMSNWTAVSAGERQTIAINSDGEIYTWGDNTFGQLGLGNKTAYNSPQRVGKNNNWISVTSGWNHCLAVNSNGQLYAWGGDLYRELGLGISVHNQPAQRSPNQVGSASNWVSVSSGEYFSIAVNSSGELYTWGANGQGQLGIENYTQQNTPTYARTRNKWIMLAAGHKFSVARTDQNEIYTWGRNNEGQLGLGNNNDASSPQRMGDENSWTWVAAGWGHVLAIRGGSLYAWGNNSNGQLGDGTTTNRNSPVRIGTATNWTKVYAGNDHSIAINSSGQVFTWGRNNYGQLGLGDNNNRTSPTQITSLGSNISSVWAGGDHTFAINSSSNLYAWGRNGDGQLGLGNNSDKNSPNWVASNNIINEQWVYISPSRDHFTLGITATGKLFAWGKNSAGQLGLGHTNSENTPQRVGSATNWSSVAAGTIHTLATNSSGELYAWGGGADGRLGLGSGNSDQTSPQRVGTASNWDEIAIGNDHNLAIDDDGELYSWGREESGELGFGTISSQSTPSFVNSSNWTSVAADQHHNIAINSDGELYAWGRNDQGQLGLGNNTNQSEPTRVGTDSNWVKVAVGDEHSLAINDSGQLYAWGKNNDGQLGIGSTTNQNSPQRVGTASNWVSIAAGSNFSVAINSLGKMYAWGSHSVGQLGIGMYSNQNSPIQVLLSNWAEVATGWGHVLAIKTDGTLYAWGNNSNGQLGLGTTTNQSAPQQIGSASNWTKVYAGNDHSIAINSSGEIYAWGLNSSGQLGTGNTTSQTSPTKVGSLTNWTSAVVGNDHTFAINSNGELYAWGKNDNGQLGLGNTTNQNSPQRVGNESNWNSVFAGANHSGALSAIQFKWSGTDTINQNSKWFNSQIPSTGDSAVVVSGTLKVNRATTLDALKLNNLSTVLLEAPLTVRNLHINNGKIDLNGQQLTITGGIYQSTDSTRYYIGSGNYYSEEEVLNAELIFAPTVNTSSTVYFDPNYNILKTLELGTSSNTAQITLGNSVKLQGGKTPSGVGSLKVNNGSKLIIPTGTSLTLQSDTFNAYLDLSAPAQRAIHCSGTGTFNIERQHYGARGWRMYAHPFSADIDLQEIADDIELIGSGGTSEGFYSDAYTNTAAYWYDYTKADTSKSTDPAWTGFTSAKGSVISSNPNKWAKHAPVIVFNPGAVRGSGAFSDPSAATYQEGKVTLSYTLDSTSVHLNDGITQSISATALANAPKSRYFLLTNPFTAPVRLGRIQGLNTTNCDNHYYFWKQDFSNLSSNFMPGTWQAEPLFNGTALRDSNICIPAFGTILLEMKNNTTAFTIPESAKQLSNFDYVIGSDLTGLSSGVKQTIFTELPIQRQGPGAIEVQVLMNDTFLVDRVLVYDREGESVGYTNNDAKKFTESSFTNIYTLAPTGEPLGLDVQDITTRLNESEEQVEIPLVIERDQEKLQNKLRLRIGEKHSDLQCYVKDAKTGILHPMESADELPIEYTNDDALISRYSLVFKRSTSSTEDIQKNTEAVVSNNPQLLAYPNPVEDQLHIRLLNYNGKMPYCIYNIAGVKIIDGTIQNLQIINTKQLQAGIYIIEANGEKVKFVKN